MDREKTIMWDSNLNIRHRNAKECKGLLIVHKSYGSPSDVRDPKTSVT
jgi:hypothetical protein